MIEHTDHTKAQDPIVLNFLADVRAGIDRSDPETKENWWLSYQQWAKGGNGWNRLAGWAGADVHTALYWYHHIHKPGSKEWRPRAIIIAVIDAAVAWSRQREAVNG